MIELALPFPPSDNTYYRVARDGPVPGMVYIGTDGKDYRKAVIEVVKAKFADAPPRLTGRLAVRLTLHVPTEARRDINNYDKGLFDALTHAEVWADDEQIDWCLIIRGRLMRGGRCVVQVHEIRPGCEQTELLLEDEGMPFW